MPQAFRNATRLWELKLSVFIPFNPITPTSGSLFKGDNLQYGKSVCTQMFPRFCSFIQPIFMGSKLRIKHSARLRIQRGARHRPVFREEDVGGHEEREWVR